jgi:hypothetical protein
MQYLVGAERKNYDRDKPKKYCGRASQQAAGMSTRGCHFNGQLSTRGSVEGQ